MTTIINLREAIYERTGSDVNHAVRIDRALNRSAQEICSVMWGFLLTSATLNILAGSILYPLPDDFQVLKEDELIFRLGDGSVFRRLLPGTPEMIKNADVSSSVAGNPTRYAMCGVSEFTGFTDRQQIAIGFPTAAVDGFVDYLYWKKPDNYGASDTPIVSTFYNDIPIISGALWIYWKNLEQNDKAADAFQEFASDMRVMGQKLPFSGPSYDQIIAIRAGQQ